MTGAMQHRFLGKKTLPIFSDMTGVDGDHVQGYARPSRRGRHHLGLTLCEPPIAEG